MLDLAAGYETIIDGLYEQLEDQSSETFECDVCKKRVPWDFGGADDMSGACDDCWARAHSRAETKPAAKKRGK